MKTISKILAILLCLTMVLGLAAVVSADDETATWTKLDGISSIGNGDVIAITVGNGTNNYILPNTASGAPAVVTVTVSDNTMTSGVASNYAWYVTSDASGYYFQAALENGGYLRMTESATKALAVGDRQAWTVDSNLLKNGEFNRYLGVYNNKDFRTYANTNSFSNQSVTFWKLNGTYTEPKAEVATVAENIKQVLDNAEDDSLWTVTGVVTYVNSSNIYIQDTTGGILIYKDSYATDPAVGDVITTTGAYDFYGVAELVKCTEYTKVTDSALTATVKDVALTALADNVCLLVKVTGPLTVTEVFDDNGSYTTPNVTAKDADGNSITLYMAPLTKDADGNWPIAVGDTINSATGVLTVNGSTYRLLSRSADEISYTVKSNDNNDDDKKNEENDNKGEETTETVKVGVMDTTPDVGTAYKLGVNHETLNKMLYFAGEIANSYYLKTTEAVYVYLEATTGGNYLYFMNGSTKTYINIKVSVSGEKTYVNMTLDATASTVYNWNASKKALVATVDGKECYLGAYGTYNTMAGSLISYIDNDGSFESALYSVEEVAKTGDTSLSLIVALMAVSAMGIAVVASKKKEF